MAWWDWHCWVVLWLLVNGTLSMIGAILTNMSQRNEKPDWTMAIWPVILVPLVAMVLWAWLLNIRDWRRSMGA